MRVLLVEIIARFIPKTFTDQLNDSPDSEHMGFFQTSSKLRFGPSFKIQFAVSLNESKEENSANSGFLP